MGQDEDYKVVQAEIIKINSLIKQRPDVNYQKIIDAFRALANAQIEKAKKREGEAAA